ncbi:hypothetical protein KDI_23410 [Dictyobacter arantiisoli]|uniref:Uncharacterized protein n=2 Tax=Dictyobacter arantiisoli TaxID=2014874 RepID=A0A5A5TBP4_9CHLR|nr:hypothetical protein KDI_23410 [Dictyobacter arantiisoli]
MQQSVLGERGRRGEAQPVSEFAAVTLSQNNVYEHINADVLEFIATLFPTGGLEFIARVLQNAKIIQNVLPGLEFLGEKVAVISVRTIRHLAQAIHWGYDTTHKYVVVFAALGLLFRHKHGKEVQLVFPLQKIEKPTTVAALDKLITQSRPKVSQFTRKVKERLILNKLLASHLDMEMGPFPLDADAPIRLHNAVYGPMLEIMRSEDIEASKGQHIALRIISEVMSKIFSPSTFTVDKQAISPKMRIEKTSKQTKKTIQASPRQSTRETRKSLPEIQKVSSQGRLETEHVEPESTEKSPFSWKVSSQGRLETEHVESESTEKSSSPWKVSSQGRLETEHVEPESTEKSPSRWKVSSQGRLETEHVEPESTEKSSYADGYPQKDEEVYQQPYEEKTFEEESLEGENLIVSVLYRYDDLLTDPNVCWQRSALPPIFFKQVHDQLYTHYLRMYNAGLLSRTRGYMWKSIELNIIRTLALSYRIRNFNACAYVFECTGRQYIPTDKDQYPPAVDSQQPVASQYPPAVDSQQPVASQYPPAVDSQQPVASQYPPAVDSQQPVASQYPPAVDSQQPVASQYPPAVDSQQPVASQYPPAVDSFASEYPSTVANTTLTESTPQAASEGCLQEPEDEEDPYVRHQRFWDNIAKAANTTPPRIPETIDSELYVKDLYEVLRERNINILFNILFNNVTLRREGARFLSETFDSQETDKEKLHKQNEQLLSNFSAKVVMNAFFDTVLSMHEPGYTTLQNPGAYFTSRCKYYKHHAVEEETLKLINNYATMTYEQFAAEMRILINSGKKIRTKQYKRSR